MHVFVSNPNDFKNVKTLENQTAVEGVPRLLENHFYTTVKHLCRALKKMSDARLCLSFLFFNIRLCDPRL